jgi:hemin uptake protein HemP
MSATPTVDIQRTTQETMAENDESSRSDTGPEDAQPQADATRVIRSEELFAGRRTVVIQHADVQYRLLITRNDRLILQK